jgi:hypothetical protein
MLMVPFDVNDATLRETLLRSGLRNAVVALHENAQPRWGKKAAQQMVEHIAWTFELSTGRAIPGTRAGIHAHYVSGQPDRRRVASDAAAAPAWRRTDSSPVAPGQRLQGQLR